MILDLAIIGERKELQLLIASLSVFLLFCAPWLAQKLLRISKRKPFRGKRRLWVAGEAMLALCLIVSFLATVSTAAIAAGIIFPWLLGIEMEEMSLDAPLTSRLILYWTGVISMGWFVFRSVGLNSTRDVHRAVKEIQDDVLQCRKSMSRRTKRSDESNESRGKMWDS